MERYEALIALGCGICGGPPKEGERYHFDHDHVTGEFRGMLCNWCNHGLGNFRDDVDRMERAILYLEAAAKRRLHAVK